MKQYIFIILLISQYFISFATQQEPDYLIVEKDTFQIYSYPLEAYFEHTERPKILDKWCSTSCFRGYVAYWKIENDSLFLSGLYDGCENQKKIDFKEIFKDRNFTQPIFADWISDTLTSSSGKRLNYVQVGYGYEKETDYYLKKGIFIGQKEYINTTQENVMKSLDSLSHFFQERIEWSNVPKTDTTIKVYVNVTADRQGKIIQTGMREADNVFFKYEALRLVGLIKDLPIVIQREKEESSNWILIVVFDPKQKK